uniref:Putative ovule protein n=1 Tax=Solanum chacoense TaxID=4108 RepID=A0A0V0HDZ8_SOLCH
MLKVKIGNQLYVETSLLKGVKPRPILNRTFQIASTNLLKAKVIDSLHNEISLLISTLSNTSYHLVEPEQIQHWPLY